MTTLANVLKLEVDTSQRRSASRNPSGRLGGFGWYCTASMVPVSGSSSPVADGGYAFSLPDLTAGATITSAPFPAPSGTNRVRFAVSSVFTASKVVRLRVMSFDATGKLLPTSGWATFPHSANTPRTVAWSAPAPPAGTATCRVVMEVAAGAGSGFTAGLYISTDGAAPLPAVWTDILSNTYSITTEQGNTLKGVEDVLTAGSLVAVVGNAALDPAVANTLQRGRPIRLTATTGGVVKDVWTGSIETADVDYDDTKGTSKPLRITLTATDDARKVLGAAQAFTLAAGFALQIAYAAQVCGLGTYDGTQSPTVTDADVTFQASDDSAKASDWMRRACNTHGGYVWIDGSNRITQRLVTYLSAAPVATMSDSHADTGALKYTTIGLNFGSRALVNDLTVKRINLDEVDGSGSKDYGPYVVTASANTYDRISGDIEITNGSPSAIANAVLPIFGTPKVFPTAMSFATHNNIAGVLALNPYDAVRVKRTTQNYDSVVRILRIRHEIRAKVGGDTWKTTVTPRPLESGTPVIVTTPSTGVDTGPSDVAPPTPGILGSRYRGAPLNIPYAQYVTIPLEYWDVWDGIEWDAANSRFVIPKDGRYQVNAAVRVQGGGGVRAARVVVNGDAWTENVANNGEESAVIAKALKLKAGDVVALQGLQYVGNPTIPLYVGGPNRNTFMDVTYLGP